jgi:NADH-quinone oxidoreductase subunit E
MEKDLEAVFSGFEGKENELIPVLQGAQKEFGYLPEFAMRKIARFVGVPESQVYAVATFYAQFRFKPMGRCRVTVCRGTACHVRGSARILDAIEEELAIAPGQATDDGAFSLETVACLGSCALAPVAVVNDKVLGKVTNAKLKKIVGQVRQESEVTS